MDEWRRAAATDDAAVADLLLRLKHFGDTRTWTTRTSSKTVVGSASSSCGFGPFRWGRRKARSRHGVSRFVLKKEFEERATCSPTTPLSWSGGCATTSVSGNPGGYEASSSVMCQKSTGSRSKISAAYDIAKSKRSKRKKTYNELKEEESSLLHERINLKRNLATLRVTIADHKMTNQNLKRIKSSNVQSRRMIQSAAERPIVCAPMQIATFIGQGAALALTARDSKKDILHPLPPFSSHNALESKITKPFVLPDLNAMPPLD